MFRRPRRSGAGDVQCVPYHWISLDRERPDSRPRCCRRARRGRWRQKQRALLAILLLNVNQPVHRDELIDRLCGEQPPTWLDYVLAVYVWRLRKALLMTFRPAGEIVPTWLSGRRIRLQPPISASAISPPRYAGDTASSTA